MLVQDKDKVQQHVDVCLEYSWKHMDDFKEVK